MQSAASPTTTLPARVAATLARVRHRLPWLAGRGRATRAPRAVTAVMLGDERCLLARVALAADGSAQLADAAAGTPADLPLWRARKLFANSQPLLVLGTDERQLLTLDRPEVPDDELQLAVRWPLAEALDCEPEALLSTALALPRINDALRPQVLAVAARLDRVQAHLKTLSAAGVKVRSIDVADSALRGMVLTQPADGDGWVVLAPSGDTMCMALVWHGQLSALRTLALAPPAQRGDAVQQEQLALHVQRTIDLFERQATQLAIRQVLAVPPSPRSPQSLQALRDALPPAARLFDLATALAAGAAASTAATPAATAAHALCAEHSDLTTLACVALARLADNHPGAALAWSARPAASEAAPSALPAAADSVAPLADGSDSVLPPLSPFPPVAERDGRPPVWVPPRLPSRTDGGPPSHTAADRATARSGSAQRADADAAAMDALP